MYVSGYRQMLNKGLVVMGEFQLQSVATTLQTNYIYSLRGTLNLVIQYDTSASCKNTYL